MSDKKINENDRLLQKDILTQVKKLMEHLETGDVSQARHVIGNLNQIREDSLYFELGKLTRELHDTLKGIDVGVAQQHMPDARNRLSYVIKLTEDAANKTMDGIEATIPISDSLSKEAKRLLDEWGRLGRREMTATEFRTLYKAMMFFLESVQASADKIHNQLQQVLVAQNYQDLTGQAIKKVMALVSDLETRLVRLIALAGEAGKITEVGNLEENVNKEEGAANTTGGSSEKATSAVVSGQDEVDDLLSSLGF